MDTDRKSVLWLVAGVVAVGLAAALFFFGGQDEPPVATMPDPARVTAEPDVPPAAPAAPGVEPPGAVEGDEPDDAAPTPSAGNQPGVDYRVPEIGPNLPIPPPDGAGPTTTAAPAPDAYVPEEFEDFEPAPRDQEDVRWVAAEYVRHARSLYYDRSPVWWAEASEHITEEHREEMLELTGSGYDDWSEEIVSSRMTTVPESLETVVVSELDGEAVVAVRWVSRVTRDNETTLLTDPQITHVRLVLDEGRWLAGGEMSGHSH